MKEECFSRKKNVLICSKAFSKKMGKPKICCWLFHIRNPLAPSKTLSLSGLLRKTSEMYSVDTSILTYKTALEKSKPLYNANDMNYLEKD